MPLRWWFKRRRPFNFYRQKYWRRRRRANTWRTRRAIPRTLYRRTRRRRRVRKYFYKHKKQKKKKIPIFQWQPKSIVKCKIKGIFDLLYCSKGREQFNFAQYQESFVPHLEPGGGSWGLYVFSLSALFQEWEKLHNFWTKSNLKYDLCRYNGVKFRFYRQDHVDYVVKYSTCYPMVDTIYTHAACHPNRLLSSNQKILVRSFHNTKSKKPYVKKYIRPPQLMKSKWFFQKELSNTPLLLLSVASTTLNSTFINPNQQSTNITFHVLNPKVFQKANWQSGTGNNYRPNATYYYWGGDQQTPPEQKPQPSQVVQLTATENRQGTPSSKLTGNIFFHRYLHSEWGVWVTSKETPSSQQDFSPLSQPLLIQCRYNPQRDTGLLNEAYILPNHNSDNFNPPTGTNEHIDGFPLWLMFWGLTDWWRKSKPGSQIDLNYTFCFKSQFVTPKLDYYVPINESFIKGLGPYNNEEITTTNLKHWYPRILYQNEVLNDFCVCGPNAPRPLQKSWEAKCEYEFFFKWGGCPPKSQDVDDPTKKPQYPIPDKISLGPQIEDPETDPKLKLFAWDFRRDIITAKALKRIRENQDIKDIMLEITERSPKRGRMDPIAYQKEQEPTLYQALQQTPPPEEIQTQPERLLQYFRNQQHLLRQQLTLLDQIQQNKYKKQL
nr:MAG: ORF1 [TTV-like mini virus]